MQGSGWRRNFLHGPKWGFPKIGGIILGVPIIRDYSIFGVYIEVPLFWEITKYLQHLRGILILYTPGN